MAYTHLLLDLDGTLFDFKAAQRNAFFHAMKQMDVTPSDEMLDQYDSINIFVWQLLEKGELTKAEILHKRFALLFAHYGLERDAALTNTLFQSELANGAQMLDGAMDTLIRLKQDYVLIAVTNGVAWSQKNRIKRAGLDQFFDRVFISEEVGFEKPSIHFFEEVAACYPNVKKEEMLMVGDSLTADILGGINFGIDTCWINAHQSESKTIKSTYEIQSIEEILPLLTNKELCNVN